MPLYAIDDSVNANSADASELEKELTDVTEAIAKRIVVYREATGPYATEEDLLKVKGIEYDTININREMCSCRSQSWRRRIRRNRYSYRKGSCLHGLFCRIKNLYGQTA